MLKFINISLMTAFCQYPNQQCRAGPARVKLIIIFLFHITTEKRKLHKIFAGPSKHL